MSSILQRANRGISTVEDLLIGPSIKTFRSLQIKYANPNQHYYKYLQVQHFLHNKNTTLALPWRIVQFYKEPSTKRKVISIFYSILNQNDTFVKTVPFKQWETHFGVIYLPSTWQKALTITHASTRSANLWELPVT